MPDQLHIQSNMYINGRWTEALDQRRYDVFNPSTNQLLKRVAYGGKEEAKRAIQAATEAFEYWSKETAEQRAQYLLHMYQLVVNNADRLAQIMTLEQGKPLEEAKGEVLWGAEFLKWYAEEARRIYGEIIPSSAPNQTFLIERQPVGVVAAITPWNFPSSMITRKIAPALAAGCTVVLKPAMETPLSAIALFELFQRTELPKGVLNLVLGNAQEIVEAFMEDERVRKISFTGSTEVGKRLMAQAAQTLKKVSLELGGHAPFIIFDDADLDQAVNGLMINKFQNAGQTCICANRIFVQERVLAPFIEKLTGQINKLRIGDGLNPDVDLGPLISKEALHKVERHVQDALEKGAKLICGGCRLKDEPYQNGHFYAPTIITGVTQKMLIYHEETFGPVIPIIPFRSEEEVIQMANDTRYGLAAYVYTRQLRRTMEIGKALQYGMVGINASTLGYVQAPFGGIKESGMGREGGKQGLDDFLEYKFLNIVY